MARAAGLVARAAALRHDALEAEFAVVIKHDVAGAIEVLAELQPGLALTSRRASAALRSSIGSRRRSRPSSSIRSEEKRKTAPPFARRRSYSKIATPASSQHTASPSTRQERQRSAFT